MRTPSTSEGLPLDEQVFRDYERFSQAARETINIVFGVGIAATAVLTAGTAVIAYRAGRRATGPS